MALIPCKNCGKTISSSAKQCPHCKVEHSINVSTINSTKTIDKHESKLTFVRLEQNDVNGNIDESIIEIIINDKLVKQIFPLQCVEINVMSGRHNIFIRHGKWFKTKPININIAPNQENIFYVGVNNLTQLNFMGIILKPINFVILLFYTIFYPSNYLELKHLSTKILSSFEPFNNTKEDILEKSEAQLEKSLISRLDGILTLTNNKIMFNDINGKLLLNFNLSEIARCTQEHTLSSRTIAIVLNNGNYHSFVLKDEAAEKWINVINGFFTQIIENKMQIL